MKQLLAFIAILFACDVGHAANSKTISIASPNGKLVVGFYLNAEGAPRYDLHLERRRVLLESRLGLIRDDADFSKGLRLSSASRQESVEDHYEILTGKRRINTYRANRRIFHLHTAAGNGVDIIFQVSNDGVAFRYFFPDKSTEVRTLKEEVSSFHFLPGTKAWLQPMAAAKSGWAQTNPSMVQPLAHHCCRQPQGDH